MSVHRLVLLCIATTALACGASQSTDTPPATKEAKPATAAPKAPAPKPQSETARLNGLFSKVFMRTVARSPFIQGYLGIKKDYDKWDDISEKRAREDHDLAVADLATLRKDYDFAKLDRQGKLSYRLFARRLKQSIEDYKWRFHSYPVNQMFGMHSQVPAFLGNFHKISSEADARAYVKRLERLPKMLGQLEVNVRLRQEKGILPPKFVFPMAIDDCRNIITGAPFDNSGKDSPILADFRKKVTAMKAAAATKSALMAAAQKALRDHVQPAYESLIATLRKQEAVATTDDGVWKLPDGAAFYARALEKTTTTKMTAEQIHALGLREVARIHGEMRAIMKKVGFKGSLQKFFRFMKTDKRFYFPNTDKGRNAYLEGARAIIKKIEAKLDSQFITKPKRGVIVKRVEAYREKSAGMAFYNPPSLFGARPGIYYVNLYDMKNLSKYEMEALAFHEAIPGHHMQNTIAMEQADLPFFRRFIGYTAYGEGWGLYSELLGKEMGFYQDPYSDFGRLAMELWRACRLVIDTGIHHKKWTRNKAIAYLSHNTPGADRDVRKAVERYIVMPSQATAYKIGMIEILRIRAKAKAALGSAFDIREFHDTVLTNGSVPLTMLEELVDRWVASKKKP